MLPYYMRKSIRDFIKSADEYSKSSGMSTDPEAQTVVQAYRLLKDIDVHKPVPSNSTYDPKALELLTENLPIKNSARRALILKGYETLGQLKEAGYRNVIGTRNVGEKTADWIMQYLASKGHPMNR